MYIAIAISNTARPDSNAGYNIGMGAEMGIIISIRARGNTDKPEAAEGKVDITTLDKINKTSILVSY